MSALPGPGWYTDPYNPGSVRWWDGTRWTDNTRPSPSVGAQAPGYGPQLAPGYVPRPGGWPKLLLIGVIIGPLLILAGVGLFAYGDHFPLIAEKSATARVVGAPDLCIQTDCSYTVVFTDASGVRVTASLSAPENMNLQVGSTTTIDYEVANPTYVSVPSQTFANDTGDHLIGTGVICFGLGFIVTVIAVVLLFQARSDARRRAVSYTLPVPGPPRAGG
jgi:hypothetical protein